MEKMLNLFVVFIYICIYIPTHTQMLWYTYSITLFQDYNGFLSHALLLRQEFTNVMKISCL